MVVVAQKTIGNIDLRLCPNGLGKQEARDEISHALFYFIVEI